MEGAVSDVAVCNLAFAGRLEELRALLLRDRAQATRADQVSRLQLQAAWGRLLPAAAHPCPADRFSSAGSPHRAALGLLGGTHGRRGAPARARRACQRQGRCESEGAAGRCRARCCHGFSRGGALTAPGAACTAPFSPSPPPAAGRGPQPVSGTWAGPDCSVCPGQAE